MGRSKPKPKLCAKNSYRSAEFAWTVAFSIFFKAPKRSMTVYKCSFCSYFHHTQLYKKRGRYQYHPLGTRQILKAMARWMRSDLDLSPRKIKRERND